jgi:hypothetical protein
VFFALIAGQLPGDSFENCALEEWFGKSGLPLRGKIAAAMYHHHFIPSQSSNLFHSPFSA